MLKSVLVQADTWAQARTPKINLYPANVENMVSS